MAIERVYNGRDNEIELLLSDDSLVSGRFETTDLSAVTKVLLFVGGTTLDSTDAQQVNFFDLSNAVDGILRLILGAASLSVGNYKNCQLILFDAQNVQGLVWGAIDIKVMASP